MTRINKKRLGGWLTADQRVLLLVIERIKSRPKVDPSEYIKPIQDLNNLVYKTPSLASATQTMFVEGYDYDPENPLGQPSVQSWSEFVSLLDAIMKTAPEFYVDSQGQAMGLVAFPINALLDWPMGTNAGYEVFSSGLFNRQMQQVLNFWGEFLSSEASRYVLAESDANSDPPTVAWLSDVAKRQMIEVACQPSGGSSECLSQKFEDIFQVPDPTDTVYMGFSSWDEFFIREFQPSQRPVGDALIVSACESAPLQYVTNVQLSDRFWLKGQPYSLEHMLGSPTRAKTFANGSIYQAFLSALSYHRWNSPIDGEVVEAHVINGSYYLENSEEGIYSPDPDPSAPNASQPFITSVASRAVIYLQACDPIGLIAFVAVGMAEVSSCEITVNSGDIVSKGDQLGMFHFGGSTHCLVFQPGVNLRFHVPVTDQPNLDASNIAVKSNLASPA